MGGWGRQWPKPESSPTQPNKRPTTQVRQIETQGTEAWGLYIKHNIAIWHGTTEENVYKQWRLTREWGAGGEAQVAAWLVKHRMGGAGRETGRQAGDEGRRESLRTSAGLMAGLDKNRNIESTLKFFTSWKKIYKTFSVHTKGFLTFKFVAYPLDKWGISRCWLFSIIIAQV